MRKYPRAFLALFIAALACLSAVAQHRVEFRYRASVLANESVFVAGSFNGWNPGADAFRFREVSAGNHSLTTTLPGGAHEFKLTRGSWQKSEVATNGAAIPNRRFFLTRDTVIEVELAGWADAFAQPVRKSTAGANVQIIDSVYMPQLGRYRRIWVYLPKGYATSGRRYPVLYMHDGQNLFEDTTAFSGEWGVDEALDTLGPQWGEAIVVGIDNGGTTRLKEYSPFDMEKYGKGEGDAYADFLVKTLKPYIRQGYRVARRGKDDLIAGSSMGGLISLYTVLKYPKAFRGAGVFSPAFWIAPGIRQTVQTRGRRWKGKTYFMAGTAESESMVPDMLSVFAALDAVSKARMQSVIRSGLGHNEATWRAEFPVFWNWMMERKNCAYKK